MGEQPDWTAINRRYGRLQAALVTGYIEGLVEGGMSKPVAQEFARDTVRFQFSLSGGTTEVKEGGA
ncbi:MAG: hypothetical protein ACREEC_10915 [Thermoplasmata archaeon]